MIDFQKSQQNNQKRYEAAGKVMPGGVNSPVRAFKAVGGYPVFMAGGDGAYLIDADGNRYLDMIGSWGPHILGHNPPQVVAALQEQLKRGTSFGAPTEKETILAEMIIERVPGMEMVRLVNSGTEATMAAIRLARGFTGRDKIVKLVGNYHGHGDSFLIKAGSGLATFGQPSSPGVPAALAELTITIEFNDKNALRMVMQEFGHEIAALILEPVAGNMGCIPAEPGYLEQARELCSDAGALLIFDEVMTGFRVARGGAAMLYGIRPDLFTFGKVIGGGLPVGGYGGRREIMQHISPSGPIYQAGTLSGNPLAVTAGIATLQLLTKEVYEKLEALGSRLEAGLSAIIQKANKGWSLNRIGSMATLFFTRNGRPPQNFSDVAASDTETFNLFFHAMLQRGFYLPPSAYEAFFLNAAMTEKEIDSFIHNAEEVLLKIK